MNILFYTSYKASPSKGGTERTTITVVNSLKKYFGCHCFSLYSVDAETVMESCFEAGLCWAYNDNRNVVIEFIRQHQIEWIVNQGAFGLADTFRVIADVTGCKVAFVHHFEPGWEEHFLRFDSSVTALANLKSARDTAKNAAIVFFFPLMRWRNRHKIRSLYHTAYELSDKVILLSENFIPQYMAYARLKENKKFSIIPNGLSYSGQFPIEKLPKKKRIVLIVSRLDEPPKRLSIALRIWNEVRKHAESEGWILNIIGHGIDEKKYRQLICRLEIPDVFMLGRQEPQKYYEEASLFMMTSRSEGWGLTLTEAQQFGVVPIAFNSYASLEDIITDGVDGVVIPECNEHMYIKGLLSLISERERRETMAANAIRNCMRFSQEAIAKQWWKLLSRK